MNPPSVESNIIVHNRTLQAHFPTLVLKQTERTLHHHVLKNRTARNINSLTFSCDNDDGTLEYNTTAKVDLTSNGKMV